jgi:hypothetical protein
MVEQLVLAAAQGGLVGQLEEVADDLAALPIEPRKVSPTCARPWSTLEISLVSTSPGRWISTEARSPVPTLVGHEVR